MTLLINYFIQIYKHIYVYILSYITIPYVYILYALYIVFTNGRH